MSTSRRALRILGLTCAGGALACAMSPDYSVRLENQNDFVAERLNVAFDDFYQSLSPSVTRGGGATMGLATNRIPTVARVRWETAGGRQHCVDIRVKEITPSGFSVENATLVFALADPERVTLKFEVPAEYGEFAGHRIVHSYKFLEPRGSAMTEACN